MCDIMKQQYAAWKKLLNQTGKGYNEDTHMEPERWEEYLKANPDAKVFHTKPLQFPKEMAILFSGTMATGEAAWMPAFGTIPDDMLRMPSENHNLSFASNPMSTIIQFSRGRPRNWVRGPIGRSKAQASLPIST